MFSSFSVTYAPPHTPHLTRKTRACDACRTLKVKCYSRRSDEHSSCDPCLRSRCRCTYDSQPVNRGRPRKLDTPRRDLRPQEQMVDLSPSSPSSSRVMESPSAASLSWDDLQRETLDYFASYPSPIFSPSAQEVLDAQPLVASVAPPPHSPQEFGSSLEGPCTREDSIALNIINEFFNSMYLIFPIFCHLELSSRLILQPDWQNAPDLCNLVYSLQLVNTAGSYRLGCCDAGILWQHIRAVESSRLMYDFADPPTLDAVAASLFLFTAYNVLGKHGRAFLYLNEAQDLVDAFALLENSEEKWRQIAVEEVLFNTQAASFALYGGKQKKSWRKEQRNFSRIRHRQTSDQLCDFNGGVGLDPIAGQLRRRMTSIYLSKDVVDIENVDVELNGLLKPEMKHHQYARIQAADVVVTRQWQLSRKLVTQQRHGNLSPYSSLLASMGIAAMSWTCILGHGELRIVGLGKLMELAIHIAKLSGGTTHQDILRGLTGAVMKEDYERAFEVPLKLLSDSTTTLAPTLTMLEDANPEEVALAEPLSPSSDSVFIAQETQED